MDVLKKIGLIFKIGFFSVFGTSKAFANLEKDIDFITGRKSPSEPYESNHEKTVEAKNEPKTGDSNEKSTP